MFEFYLFLNFSFVSAFMGFIPVWLDERQGEGPFFESSRRPVDMYRPYGLYGHWVFNPSESSF